MSKDTVNTLTKEQPFRAGSPVELTDAIETWINPETGVNESRAGKVIINAAELSSLLARDAQDRTLDPTSSYIHTPAIVGSDASDDLTKAVLARDNLPHAHSHTAPSPVDRNVDETLKEIQQDKTPFVGTNLSYKVKPKGLPKEGKNPTFNGQPGIRRFVGDEFPRMLGFGAPRISREIVRENGRPTQVFKLAEEAKPAFYSLWPEGTKPEDMKVLKINIATKVPQYMLEGALGATMEGRKEFAFKGQSLSESFVPVSDKVEKEWRRFAEDFEASFGIKLDVRKDTDPDAHKPEEVSLSVLGFQKGEPRLAGFASFPEAMNEWQEVFKATLGHKQGFMMLNHEYTNNKAIDGDMVYDLIAHEFGHRFGMCHPHDLGQMKMSQADALNHTMMAYTDGKFSRMVDQDGKEQEGLLCGPVELSLRKFLPNAPKLNDSRGTVYDLGAHSKKSFGVNWNSRVMAQTGQIPAVPIVNNGTGAVLRGTTGNDILDTEPGHESRVKNSLGVEQRYSLVEGHFAKVIGLAGNNDIFTSSKGDQEILPGIGENKIHIYDKHIGDKKTILSTGRDTLVLHEDIFFENRKDKKVRGQDDAVNHSLKVTQQGDDIVLTGHAGGSIVLKDQVVPGKGVTAIEVVDDSGRRHITRDVSRFTTPERFEKAIVEAMAEETPELLSLRRKEAVAARKAAQVQGDDGHDHLHSHLQDAPPAQPETTKASSHVDALRARAEANKAAGTARS